MTQMKINSIEKSRLVSEIEHIVSRLVNIDDNQVINGMFTYIQNDERVHEEYISQEDLRVHPFISSFNEDKNFKNSLINSSNTEIYFENKCDKEYVYTIIVKENDQSEINIALNITEK